MQPNPFLLAFNAFCWLPMLLWMHPSWLLYRARASNSVFAAGLRMPPSRATLLRNAVHQVLEDPTLAVEVIPTDSSASTAVWKDERTVCLLISNLEPHAQWDAPPTVPDPLEFVAAHEAAHLKFGDRRRCLAWVLLSGLLTAGAWGTLGGGWGTLVSFALRFFALSVWSRSVERRADLLAMDLADAPHRRIASGIVWLETIRQKQLFHRETSLGWTRRLVTEDGDNLGDFLHPPLGERLQTLRDRRAALPKSGALHIVGCQ